jgi:tryptophanyl-tRNA synthetase
MIKRALSGITPSGANLHIGNYFGAIKQQIELQNSIEQTIYFIADLHALTTVQDKVQLQRNIRNVVLDYLALGVDPERSIFFRQSDVPAHSQLSIILANYISLSHMQRMHAYKDKLAKDNEADINMGLFNYPILMAADILIYQPDGVPVGEDQKQHVELTRDIAQNFNKKYGSEILKLPEPLISKTLGKIIGTDGSRKMSKSLGNVIGIFDSEEIIRKQIFSCFTDPNRIKATDPGKVEGNPVFIFHDLLNQNQEEVNDLKQRYLKGSVGDVEVKQKLLDAHLSYFKTFRERRVQLESNPKMIDEILDQGALKAQQMALNTLTQVEEAIGLKNIFN